jgi:hypothetical protein
VAFLGKKPADDRVGLFWFTAAMVGLVVYGQYHDAKVGPAFYTGIIEACAIVGALTAFFFGRVSGGWLARIVRFDPEPYKNYAFDNREGRFVGGVFALIGIYAIAYGFAAKLFVDRAQSAANAAAPHLPGQSAPLVSTWPISIGIVSVTAATIGLFAFFVVRYAAFIKAMNFLRDLTERPDVLKGQVRQGTELAGLIRNLRQFVLREEHLYEPPGNIFSTVGIAATFLGLAIGLVLLNPGGLASGQGDADGSAMSGLESFVGGMGLALGVSMLGVFTAIGAQWLRGQAPTDCPGEPCFLPAETVLELAIVPGGEITPDHANGIHPPSEVTVETTRTDAGGGDLHEFEAVEAKPPPRRLASKAGSKRRGESAKTGTS